MTASRNRSPRIAGDYAISDSLRECQRDFAGGRPQPPLQSRRNRGLTQFLVRSMDKVKTIAL
jgi:hypothetical protein